MDSNDRNNRKLLYKAFGTFQLSWPPLDFSMHLHMDVCRKHIFILLSHLHTFHSFRVLSWLLSFHLTMPPGHKIGERRHVASLLDEHCEHLPRV